MYGENGSSREKLSRQKLHPWYAAYMKEPRHPIQLEILLRLREQSPQTYSQLRPGTVEGNVFVYHIKALIKHGFIVQTIPTYQLTVLGKQFVERMSKATKRITLQPKIATLLVLQNMEGAYAVVTQSHEPHRQKLCFPHGKLHLGESITEAATRESVEKLQIVPISCEHLGDVYCIVKAKSPSQKIILHTLYHLCRITAAELPTVQWTSTLKPSDSVPGHVEILAQLQSGQIHNTKTLVITSD
jgi:ADP-ribose pyrophosphatase YjhB (NUDIX family)